MPPRLVADIRLFRGKKEQTIHPGTTFLLEGFFNMSYVRTEAALRDLHAVKISPGGIAKIMQRAGQQAGQQMEPIQNEIQQSKVIHSDETGSWVDGQNWWQ